MLFKISLDGNNILYSCYGNSHGGVPLVGQDMPIFLEHLISSLSGLFFNTGNSYSTLGESPSCLSLFRHDTNLTNHKVVPVTG